MEKKIDNEQNRIEAFAKLKNELKELSKLKDAKKVEMAKTIQYNAPGGIIQQWMREFDELYKSTGNPSHQVKTVEYCEIRLNQLEFLDMKQKEFNNQ